MTLSELPRYRIVLRLCQPDPSPSFQGDQTASSQLQEVQAAFSSFPAAWTNTRHAPADPRGKASAHFAAQRQSLPASQPAADPRVAPFSIEWANHPSETSERDAKMLGGSSSNAWAAGAPPGLSRQTSQQSAASSSRSPIARSSTGPLTMDPSPERACGTTPPRSPQASGSGPSLALPPTPRTPGSIATEVPTPLARFEQTSTFKVGEEEVRPGESTHGFQTGVVEVAFGVVHLYREDERGGAATSSGGKAAAGSSEGRSAVLTDQGDDSGTILAVLAVPARMRAADFLNFIEPALEAISHVRVIRESSPGACMILLKLRDALDAEEFHKMFNGRAFNAMRPEELCQVVYVTSVTVADDSPLRSSAPLANSDPWPLPSPTAADIMLTELPTCPVCLDRMDSSVTGLLTVTCQHTFHCSCLSRWEDSRCPVCRYSQTKQARKRPATRYRTEGGAAAEGTSSAEPAEDEEASACGVCSTQVDLWVCLICASVGCGRYKGGHAHRHFEQSGHAYSLELETQRVWSYVEDSYVHRLIQSKADGKLVELPSASSATATPERTRRGAGSRGPRDSFGTPLGAGKAAKKGEWDDDDEEYEGGAGPSSLAGVNKIDAIDLEYSYLLTSQLDSQRAFYEDKVKGLQGKLDDVLRALDETNSNAEALRANEAAWQRRLEEREAAREKEEAARVRSDKRVDKAMELARKFEREMQAERSVGQGLMRRLEAKEKSEEGIRRELDGLKKQNADLQEQMRDLMFYVSAREKMEAEGGEAAGGDIAGVAPAPKTSAGKKKKKKAGGGAMKAAGVAAQEETPGEGAGQ